MTKEDKEEFRGILKEYQNNTDTLVKKLKEESVKEMKHYIGGLQEDYNWKVEAILENTKGQQVANEKVDIMFDNMGKQEVDIEVLKESARDHERRLQKIER